MDVQAIDNDIQSHISANPSENAEHLNKWLHEKYKGSKLESQLPTLDHIKYKLRTVKDALGYSSIDYVKSEHLKDTSTGHAFLRSVAYHLIPNKVNKDVQGVDFNYAIWCSGFSLSRMRDSQHFFIDATFDYIPHPFTQLLVIMFEDFSTKKVAPGIFVLMDSKLEMAYEIVLAEVNRLLHESSGANFSLQSITVDFEVGLQTR